MGPGKEQCDHMSERTRSDFGLPARAFAVLPLATSSAFRLKYECGLSGCTEVCKCVTPGVQHSSWLAWSHCTMQCHGPEVAVLSASGVGPLGVADFACSRKKWQQCVLHRPGSHLKHHLLVIHDNFSGRCSVLFILVFRWQIPE